MDATRIESELRSFFASNPGDAVAVYLYGSVARGTAREGSDVDVGVLLEKDPPRTLRGMKLDLEADLESLLEVPVQLVVLNRAPPDLIHRILRDGKLVLDRDRSMRIRFEVKARNEFFDLQPILRRYRRFPEPRIA
jgi:predicted nucleotidyltransferase